MYSLRIWWFLWTHRRQFYGTVDDRGRQVVGTTATVTYVRRHWVTKLLTFVWTLAAGMVIVLLMVRLL